MHLIIRLALWNSEPQLGIEVNVVVPGQPVGGVQLTARQSHHLRETGLDPIDLVDDALGCDDVLIADDLYRTLIDAGEGLAGACSGSQGKGTTGHLDPIDQYMYRGL